MKKLKATLKITKNNKGQSLVEFLLFVPVLLGIVALTYKVNIAIQMSIVNQKYARAQTLHLVYNSPIYPELRFRAGAGNKFGRLDADQMIVGVSNNIATEGYTPEASTQVITRTGKAQGDDSPSTEDSKSRGKIRIRNTVALCTQFNPPSADSIYDLNEVFQDGNFTYCRSLYK